MILNEKVFQDPDNVGQTEYRLLYELAQDAADNADDDGVTQDEANVSLRDSLREVIEAAQALLAREEPLLLDDADDEDADEDAENTEALERRHWSKWTQ